MKDVSIKEKAIQVSTVLVVSCGQQGRFNPLLKRAHDFPSRQLLCVYNLNSESKFKPELERSV